MSASSRANGTRAPDLPYAVEAEQAVLGAAIHDPGTGALAWLAGNLKVDDFYRPAHRAIAKLLLELFGAGISINPVVVMTALSERGLLAEVGGGSYLHDLDAAWETTANLPYFGSKVREASRLRQILDYSAQVAQACREPGWDANRVAGESVAWFQQLLDDAAADEIARRPEHLLEAVREAGIVQATGLGARWGLHALDDVTGGLHPGDLVLVAARTSVGKSSLLIQAAAHNAERMPVLFVSYEMGQAEIGQHILAAYSYRSLEEAKTEYDTPRMQAAAEAVRQLDLTVFEHDPDVATLCAQVQAMHSQQPLGLVCVDYLQKVPASRRTRATTREQEVSEVSDRLQKLGRRIQVPVVAASQLNRGAVDRLPELHDLRDSGAQEQDADQVILLHREDGARKATAILGKNRMGDKDRIPLDWIGKSAVFADPLPSH